MLPSSWIPLTAGLVILGVSMSFALTALARLLAPRLGFVDRPDDLRKSHARPTPVLGGVAVFLSLVCCFAVAALMRAEWLTSTAEHVQFASALLVSGGLYCLLGVFDDRMVLSPRAKFLLQILAALPFVAWGRSIDSIFLLGYEVQLNAWGAAFTVLWLVACVNAINLVDGLDGLAGTVGGIICLAVGFHSAIRGQFEMVPIALVMSACIAGFLVHNWPPAKIFLGDSGSLTIGFLVGALALEGGMKKATGFAFAIPIVLISVPAFDTAMAIIRRKLYGRGIGEGDRGHIHHRLQDRGLSTSRCLIVMAALCLSMAAATLLSAYFQNDVFALATCGSVLTLLIVGRVFGYDETVMLFKYLRTVSRSLNETSGLFRNELALARFGLEGSEHAECWSELVEIATDHGVGSIEFSCFDGAGEVVHREYFSSGATKPETCDQWSFSFVAYQDGLRRKIYATGSHRPSMSTLEPLLVTFCRSWHLQSIPFPASDADLPLLETAMGLAAARRAA